MRIAIVIGVVCVVSTMVFAAPVRPDRLEMRSAGSRSVPRLVEATILPSHHNTGTAPSSSSQLNAYTVGCGREIDQAGHAIPKVLGGSGAKENIYPLNKQLNNRLGNWERKLGDMLKTGKCASIDYKVALTFGDDKLELRPTIVTIRATCMTPDGKKNSMGYTINNTKPKSCSAKTYPDH